LAAALKLGENFEGILGYYDFFNVEGVSWFGCGDGLCAKDDSPFCFVLLYSSQSYSNVLFKAYLYKNVRAT